MMILFASILALLAMKCFFEFLRRLTNYNIGALGKQKRQEGEQNFLL